MHSVSHPVVRAPSVVRCSPRPTASVLHAPWCRASAVSWPLRAAAVEADTTKKDVDTVTTTPAASAAAPSTLPALDVSETVLLQAFGWHSSRVGNWYSIIANVVPDIKAAGFTHVWLPPPSQSVSREGYLPSDLYNLNTPYGSKDELKQLCAALKDAGVRPVADIVINHRSAGAQGPDGRWNQFTDTEDHPGARLDWGPWAITGNDPDFGGRGQADTGDDFGPAPDIDHSNQVVRQGISDWLSWLHTEIGFEGFRFDYVKGFGAQYVEEYINASIGPSAFHVSEYWTDMNWTDQGLGIDQNAARQALCDYLDKSGAASFMFDFPLKGVLNEAASKCEYWRLADAENKAPGLNGWGSTQQHWPFPHTLIDQGYAYILLHPGVPCVLWEHYFDLGHKDKINELLHIRARNGITSKATLEILAAENDMYVARVNGRVLLKMGPRYDMGPLLPAKEDGWRFALSGRDWAVWERSGPPVV